MLWEKQENPSRMLTRSRCRSAGSSESLDGARGSRLSTRVERDWACADWENKGAFLIKPLQLPGRIVVVVGTLQLDWKTSERNRD